MNFRLPIRLLANARGAAVIEMAMIAPVLALGVIGIVDISNAYSRKLALEQGAQRAIEKIMNTTENATVEATLANEVQCQVNGSTTSGGVTTCNTSATQAVTVTWRLDCTDGAGTVTTQSTTSSATYDAYTCAGGTVRQARYVEVGVTDKYTPLFPVHFSSFTSSDGTYHISAKAGTRTS
jgi:Flp pilus assembly protein TadG